MKTVYIITWARLYEGSGIHKVFADNVVAKEACAELNDMNKDDKTLSFTVDEYEVFE